MASWIFVTFSSRLEGSLRLSSNVPRDIMKPSTLSLSKSNQLCVSLCSLVTFFSEISICKHQYRKATRRICAQQRLGKRAGKQVGALVNRPKGFES
eukprot:1623543-Amphidinium_carterae.1